MKQNVLRVMIGTIILEVILVCFFILLGSFDDISYMSTMSVGIIFFYSIPCFYYSKIYDKEDGRNIAIGGASIACVVAFFEILIIWELFDPGDFLMKIIFSLNVIVWMLAFISEVLFYSSVNNLLDRFISLSITLMLLLGFFSVCNIWLDMPEGFPLRLYFVLIVLTIGMYVCTMILTKIYKKEINQAQSIQKNDIVLQNNEQSDLQQNDVLLQNNEQSDLQQNINNYEQNEKNTSTESLENSSQITNPSVNTQQNSIDDEKK